MTINTEPLEVCPLCGTDDILYPSVAEEYRNEIELSRKAAELERDNAQMLSALKLAYRKHHLDDISIGWVELSERLLNVLAEVMGDDGYVEWLAALEAAKDE